MCVFCHYFILHIILHLNKFKPLCVSVPILKMQQSFLNMLGCYIFLNLVFVYFDTFKNLSCIFSQCAAFTCMAFQQLLVIALNDQVHQVFDM